jgi:hypothetical protein
VNHPGHPFEQAPSARPEFAAQIGAPQSRAPVMWWRNLLASLVAFGLGLVLQFNPLSATWHLPFLRLSDAIMFVTIFAMIPVLTPRLLRGGAPILAVMLVLTMMTVRLKASPAQGDTYFSLTFFASAVAGYFWAAAVSRDQRFAVFFSFGWLIGFVLAVVVLFLRASGLDLTPVGLGVPVPPMSLSAMLAMVKPGGLWVHGNEAGHVFALAGGPALYLALRFKRPIIYLAYYVVFLASFTVTLNRGGVIAPTAGLAVAYLAAGQGEVLLKITLGFCGLLIILAGLYFLPQFEAVRDTLSHRFLADSNLNNNAGDRFSSLLAGVQTAFNHPFGIGNTQRMIEMIYIAHGVGTPHNAFITLAFQCGLLPVALFIVSIVKLLSKPSNRTSVVGLITIFALPSMFFEELTINPVFLFAIALTIAAAWLPQPRTQARVQPA